MDQYVVFALLGLGSGALYAALAQGLVLAYRAAGVVNFATGAMAMYVTYMYSELRATGQLVVPPVPNPLSLIEWLVGLVGVRIDLWDIPEFVSFGAPLNFWSSFTLAALGALLLGLLLHLLAFRPLRNAPTLARVVASVGVMITLQAIVTIRFGSASRAVPKILPTDIIDVSGNPFPVDRLILAAVVVVIAVCLWALFKFTRLGWATQAAAENEKGAILAGLAPDRLAAWSWMLSTLVAGVTGILFSTFTALTPTNFTLFIVPALAAALVARFTSFLIAAVAGLLIGAAQGVIIPLGQDLPWLPFGADSLVPLVIVILVVLVGRSSIPTRGEIVESGLPAAPEPGHPMRFLLPLLVVGGFAAVWLPFGARGALINTLIGTIVALSLVVITGFVGQISLMQMALAGAAAMAMIRVAGAWGLPFPLAPLLAALVAGLVGVAAAAPALRVRGVHLAIVTLTCAAAFEAMVLRNPAAISGADAVTSLPSPSFGGLGFGINDDFVIERDGIPNPGFALFVLIVVVLLAAVVMNWRRSSTGRLFLAIRSNERAAAAVGINVSRVKVLAFGGSAFFVGLAGALSSYTFQGVSVSSFTVLVSISALAVAYLGGITTVGGAMWGGVLMTGGLAGYVMEQIYHNPEYQFLIAGLGLVLTAILNPIGIAGVVRHVGQLIAHRFQSTRSAQVQEKFSLRGEEA